MSYIRAACIGVLLMYVDHLMSNCLSQLLKRALVAVGYGQDVLAVFEDIPAPAFNRTIHAEFNVIRRRQLPAAERRRQP